MTFEQVQGITEYPDVPQSPRALTVVLDDDLLRVLDERAELMAEWAESRNVYPRSTVISARLEACDATIASLTALARRRAERKAA